MKSKYFIIFLKLSLIGVFAFLTWAALWEILYAEHVDGFIPYIGIITFILFLTLLFNFLRNNLTKK
ncbi:uncharacterized protein METZ01_LOCUS17594 [marine metagenome]|uniref:Uncharacterized protein n=1 Tax=marine metagenome TaxID=408172 RepID=A0A381PCS6_9ZZZZ|tara:strand:- start:1710 stop:1907 length:198 start_codon:yes stop_codon:yes gene_type:complete